MQPNESIVDLAGAILDGRAIDWDSVESDAELTDRPLLGQLRLVAAVADVHRTAVPGSPLPAAQSSRRPRPQAMEWGHLRVLDQIGHGAFGRVYRAWDMRLDRHVALKLLPSSRDASGSCRSTIIEEGRLLARVRHPNVVTIYGADHLDGQVGLWMELVDGHTLADTVRRRGSLPAGEVARIGIELCGAVAAVHGAGLLHRDIKAHNVMLAADGRVVLMDFGTGWEVGEGSGPALAGTPLYLAPELLRGGGEPTERSDIYSLGVVLFHLLTGSYPVRAASVAGLRAAHGQHSEARSIAGSGIPASLAALVERALEPRPQRRFRSAAEMRQALAAVTEVSGTRETSGELTGAGRTAASRRRPALLTLLPHAVLTGSLVSLAAGHGRDSTVTSAGGMREASTSDTRALVGAQGTRSPEAYRHYVFGRSHLEARSQARVTAAEREFRAAVTADPRFARAYAALSVTLTHSAWLGARRGIDVTEPAREAALKALTLDESVGLAHTALAYVYECFDHDRARSLAEHLRAIALDDRDPWVVRGYANFLMRDDRFDEALDIVEAAIELDPASPLWNRHHAMILYAARRYGECVAVSRRTLPLDPNDSSLAHKWLGRCLEGLGRFDEAIDAYETGRAAHGDAALAARMRTLYARSGWRAYWEAQLRRANSESIPSAEAYVRLGDVDSAIRVFEQAYQERHPWVLFTNHPEWDPLRSDPRLQALRRRAGLSDGTGPFTGPSPRRATGRTGAAPAGER